MRASLQVVGVALAFTIISLSPIAGAEPKEEVAAATAAWAQALGEDDPDKVLPLYSSDAVLWEHAITETPVRSGSATGLFRGRL